MELSYSSLVVPNDETVRDQNRLCIGYNLFDSNRHLAKRYGDDVLKINVPRYPQHAINAMQNTVTIAYDP
eukprot:5768515-Prymnesium_polylepis.1